jgi:predicted MPP superfamily phosphohydrolase
MPQTLPPNLAFLAGVAIGGAAVLAADAFLIEPLSIQVTRHDLPLPRLPAGWEGARMVHVSDLHYGDPFCNTVLGRMVEKVNALEPDLIVITGDFILEHGSEIAPCARFLAQLKSRRGIVAVLGDHDYFERTTTVMEGLPEALADAGVRLLRNDAVELEGGLRIAGTEPFTRKVRTADLGKALGACPPEGPHLLLSHSPDLLPDAAERGVPMLLCGHTHGGQVVVPFYGPPVTHTRIGRRFASGWSSMQGTRLYTNRGLASHLCLRFLCPPEIAVFRLTRAT